MLQLEQLETRDTPSTLEPTMREVVREAYQQSLAETTEAVVFLESYTDPQGFVLSLRDRLMVLVGTLEQEATNLLGAASLTAERIDYLVSIEAVPATIQEARFTKTYYDGQATAALRHHAELAQLVGSTDDDSLAVAVSWQLSYWVGELRTYTYDAQQAGQYVLDLRRAKAPVEQIVAAQDEHHAKASLVDQQQRAIQSLFAVLTIQE